jgi:hypothetical protein
LKILLQQDFRADFSKAWLKCVGVFTQILLQQDFEIGGMPERGAAPTAFPAVFLASFRSPDFYVLCYN